MLLIHTQHVKKKKTFCIWPSSSWLKACVIYFNQFPWQNHAWERYTDVSQPPPKPCCLICFNFQPNMLPISMNNKQSGRGVLEHRLSSQPPRCLYGLFSLPYLLTEKFLFSLSPHQSRPQTHTEPRPGTEGILCNCYCDVPVWVIQSVGGSGRTKAGRDM